MTFPKDVDNRPALRTVDTRIGDYNSVREHVLRALDTTDGLAGFTYRGLDDPAIALLDSAALVAEVLLFYTNLYANETFLRTAKWRESVADLVRLYGYRLSPGISGRGTFAFEVTGAAPVTVPASTALRASVVGAPGPATFETEIELSAHRALNRFRLYRPWEVPRVGSEGDTGVYRAAPGIQLAKGERLLLLDPSALGAASGWNEVQLDASASMLAIVEEVLESGADDAFGAETLIRVAGGKLDMGAEHEALVVYRLGRSHHHFGHDAPRAPLTSSAGTLEFVDVYERAVASGNFSTQAGKPALATHELLLERNVESLVPGRTIVVDVLVDGARALLPRRVLQAESMGAQLGVLSGSGTLLTLNAWLTGTSFDVRRTTVHEVIGEPFLLSAAPQPAPSAQGNVLHMAAPPFAPAELVGRRVILRATGGGVTQGTIEAVRATGGDWVRPLVEVTLDQEVPFAGHALTAPTTEVFGNLVDATEGESTRGVVLGSGDAQSPWQSLAIPKTPLTFLLAPSATPAEVPELTLWVDGKQWTRVASFYGRGPEETLYVVRTDYEGRSWVQCGDGKTGARFPTARDNIVANFRSGSGAFGALKPGTAVQLQGRIEGVRSVQLLGAVTGGGAPETADKAAEAGPATLQTLGRIVSIADYEAEVLALPGVLKAGARWGLLEGSPAVQLTVLMAAGREADFAEVRRTLVAYDRERGADRHAIVVTGGSVVAVYVSARVAVKAGRRPEPVLADVRRALGLGGGESEGFTGQNGLFGVRARRFGQTEYANRVLATIQNVDGVAWVQLTGFDVLPATGSPIPALKTVRQRLVCPESSLLQLTRTGLIDPLELSALQGDAHG